MNTSPHHCGHQYGELLRELREHAAAIADQHRLTGADRLTLQAAAERAYHHGADIDATLASTRRIAEGLAGTQPLQVAA